MGVQNDCYRLVQETIDGLGGLDIIVSNAVSKAMRTSLFCCG